MFGTASGCRAEFVLQAEGVLRERSSKNMDIPTGEVELAVRALKILARSETPPFAIEEGSATNDSLRLKYRYLDLRRPDMQRALQLRHKVVKVCRDYFDEQGFLEIETPILTKSTPEGPGTIWCPPGSTPASFMPCPSPPSSISSF